MLWDPACEPIVQRAAAELAGALAAVVDAVDPEAIVLGGGLGLERGYSGLWEPDMRARLFSRDTAKLDIVEAELAPTPASSARRSPPSDACSKRFV